MKKIGKVFITFATACSLNVIPAYAENKETSTAYFFLHAYNEIRKEDGNTIAYPLSDYYPGASEHRAISGQIYGIATGQEVESINTKLSNLSELTESEENDLINSFSKVEEVLGDGYPTLQNNSKLKQIVLTNYNVSEQDIDSGKVKALWYVVKTGKAIGNDGCGYHVDGIIYNTETKSVTPVKKDYYYTIIKKFYEIKDGEETLIGSTKDDSIKVDKSDYIDVTVNESEIYDYLEYTLDDDKTKTIIPTEEGVTVEFKYIREEKAPEPEPEPTPTPEPEPTPTPEPEPEPEDDSKGEVEPEPIPNADPKEEIDDGIGDADDKAVDTADKSQILPYAIISIASGGLYLSIKKGNKNEEH